MKRLLTLSLCVILAACSDEQAAPGPLAGSIVVAVLPDQSAATLAVRHRPLMDYLQARTALEIEFVIPRDYADLVDQFDRGGVDLAWFGGLTYTQAEARSQAEPLAFRDVDLRFTSCYLARSTDTRSTIRAFEGAELAFGPHLSTSGHLMPRFFLERDGLYPAQFFAATRHSAGHDQTAFWVRDGVVAIGVANCVIVQSLFDAGSLSSDNVRIIETTPPYSDYVWAVKASMDQRTRTTILDALLALDASNPEHLAILRSQGANAYMPAAPGNFVLVRRAAKLAGLVEDYDDT